MDTSLPEARTETRSTPLAAGRVLGFALLLLCLSIQRDGFTMGVPGPRQQALLFVGALLALAAVQAVCTDPIAALGRLVARWSLWRVALAIAAASEAASGVLFWLAARHFASIGYRWLPLPGLLVFVGMTCLLLFAALRKKPVSAGFVIASVMLSVTAVFALTIHSFPLLPQRSDMLPLIAAADHVFLQAHDPYRFYALASGSVFLTYLPGTWLAYLPASALGLDLRWISLACYLALILAVWLSVRPGFRRECAGLLGIFFCSPYLQYRHEIYTGPFWLCLAIGLLLMIRGRPKTSGVFLGLSVAMYQFAWVLFPFWYLYWQQRTGWKKALIPPTIALAVAALIICPFLLVSPSSMVFGVLGHWKASPVVARVVNLSYWTARAVGVRHLTWVQGIILEALSLFCWWRKACRTAAGCFHWMAVGLLIFVLLNFLVWGYFFLTVALLLLFYVLAANGWLAEASPDQRASTT